MLNSSMTKKLFSISYKKDNTFSCLNKLKKIYTPHLPQITLKAQLEQCSLSFTCSNGVFASNI